MEFTDRPQDDPSQRQPDIGLARTQLSWEPKIDITRRPIADIAWFRDRAETGSC